MRESRQGAHVLEDDEPTAMATDVFPNPGEPQTETSRVNLEVK